MNGRAWIWVGSNYQVNEILDVCVYRYEMILYSCVFYYLHASNVFKLQNEALFLSLAIKNGCWLFLLWNYYRPHVSSYEPDVI